MDQRIEFGLILLGILGIFGGNVTNTEREDSEFLPVYKNDPILPPESCQVKGNKSGICVPIAQCAVFYSEIEVFCNPGSKRICCPIGEPLDDPEGRSDMTRSGILRSPTHPKVKLPLIGEEELKEAVLKGTQRFERRQKKITNLLLRSQGISKGSPVAFHRRLFPANPDLVEDAADAQLHLEISKHLVRSFNLTKHQRIHGLPLLSAKDTPLSRTCPSKVKCRKAGYRSINGECNNLKNPEFGKAGIPLGRVLPAQYNDGIDSPRKKGSNGRELPSPRLISSSMFQDQDRPYPGNTLMLMQWGQFINHDMSHTILSKGPKNDDIACCFDSKVPPPDSTHPDCFPIRIPKNDPFFGDFGEECMDFVRAMAARRRGCNLFGPRQQLNEISAFIDASNIYGSNDVIAGSLRQGEGGRLKANRVNGRDYLPPNKGECSDMTGQKFCFRAGDKRVNEQAILAILHTLWLREHNRIAGELSQINPDWGDDTIYQETRRIIIGEMQHIIYNEYLPIIIGPKLMTKFGLTPAGTSGFRNLYNPEVDPGITNAFTTAAFRFGHSMVQGIVKGFDQNGEESEVYPLDKIEFSPFMLYDDGSYDALLRGLLNQPSQRFDLFVSESLTRHLFQGDHPFGLDLISFNIQRGRDNGLSPYNDWREICHLPRASNWGSLNKFLRAGGVKRLRRLYSSPDDIDLFVGGLSEKPSQGALLGPTFACLVADQFSRVRRGDRFFYEEATSRFTEAQLADIKKTSLARIICDNSDGNIEEIQPLVFMQSSEKNAKTSCSDTDSIPAINFDNWKATN